MPRSLLSLSRARRPLPSAFLVLDAYGVFGSIYTPYGSLLFPNNLLIKPIYLSHGSLNFQTKYGIYNCRRDNDDIPIVASMLLPTDRSIESNSITC
jgi:hypothetical protein